MPTVQSVYFGLSPEQQYDDGTRPSIAINAGNRVVEAHQGETEDKLYFRVASVSGVSLTFQEVKQPSYAAGQNPAVAALGNTVIEAHDKDGKVYYSIGRLGPQSVTPGPATELPHPLPSSSDPTIAVNAHGVAVAVHRAGDDLVWRVGSLDDSATLRWSAGTVLASSRTNPSVSINDSGRVVVVYENGDDLYYRIGDYVAPKGNDPASITFRPEPSHRYDTGDNPSVAITADDWVFEVHTSETVKQLFQRVGQVSKDGTSIEWQPFLGGSDPSYMFDNGQRAAVATNGEVAVHVHQSETRTSLFGTASLVFDRANWIHDNFRQLRNKTLRELVLPGSHDAAQYRPTNGLQAQTLDIFGQLSAGVRWFDLRLGRDGDTIKIHHDVFFGVDFQVVLDDVRRFIKDHHELILLKISHFRNFNQRTFESALAMIKDTEKGVGSFLVTRDLEKRLGRTTLRELVGPNIGAVLVVVDNKDDSDNVSDAFDFDPRKPINRGIRRYRDWYAADPQKGDLTVFDIYSHTDDFKRMATGDEDDPDEKNAVGRNGKRLPVGQLPKFELFDGICRFQDPDGKDVPCDLFLLSWTLTRDAVAPVLYYQPANKQLVEYSAMNPSANTHDQIINLLYTDVSQASRSTDVALIRNGLA